MKVLSLFDGMSCGQIALRELGIIPSIYYASEIDTHAIKQTQLNFPETIQLGSVVDVDISTLEPIDLLIGGSPCQSFSFAGKRKGMATSCNEEIYTLDRYMELKRDGFEFEGQSYLFWEYMRILNDIRKYNQNIMFLLENVEMGNKWERVLSEAIGIYGVHINSALVSAQNRKRIYWTNIRIRQQGLFGELHSDIPQPDDKGILLRDILEENVEEKYFLSEKMIKNMKLWDDSKNGVIGHSGSGGQKGSIYNTENKIGSLCATDYKQAKQICVAMRGRNPDNPSDRTTGAPTEQRLEPKIDGKTNCLTSVTKDNLIMQLTKRQQNNFKRGDEKANSFLSTSWKGSQSNGMTLVGVIKDGLVMQLNPSKESGGKQPYQQNRFYDTDGISPALSTDSRPPAIVQHGRGFNKGGMHEDKSPVLTSNSWEQNNHLVIGKEKRPEKQISMNNSNSQSQRIQIEATKSTCLSGEGGGGGAKTGLYLLNYRIRRLTPTECARLQTVPAWYKWQCSDTQQYRMLGNGWTIEVIKHILSYMTTKNIEKKALLPNNPNLIRV